MTLLRELRRALHRDHVIMGVHLLLPLGVVGGHRDGLEPGSTNGQTLLVPVTQSAYRAA